jgi:hypothetical protein
VMKSGSEPSVSKAMKSQREVEIGGLFGPISGALAFIHSGNLVRGHNGVFDSMVLPKIRNFGVLILQLHRGV